MKKIYPWLWAAILIGGYIYFHFGNPSFFGIGWFFWYELAYTLAVVGFGIWVIRKYRNAYMTKRTLALMAVQIFLGFLPLFFLPIAWGGGDGPASMGMGTFLEYVWPLEVQGVMVTQFPVETEEGTVKLGEFYREYFGTNPAMFFFLYSVIAGMLVMPVLVYFKGKRVYCSWFCGCGGLAETFGELWRKRSPKGPASYKTEYVVWAFVVWAVVLTALVWAGRIVPGEGWLFVGFDIIAKFWLASVVGVGFYPLMGGRIWCRYFCPWAGLFGWISKHGRYRIETDVAACMSCGQCTEYCEMGIDVRSFAQRGEPVRTTTCVGCGVCEAICPRNALHLTAKPKEHFLPVLN